MRGFTGIRDIDFMILDKLNNKTMCSCSLVNKYINILCKEEIFWLNKYIKTFGEEAKIYKPENMTWKDQFLKVKKDTSNVKDPWKFFDRIIWKIHTSPDWLCYDLDDDRLLRIKEQSEKIQNLYHFLNLGKTFTMVYLIDFENGKYTKVNYNNNKSYTPEKVINLIFEFYQNPDIFPDINKKLFFQGFDYKSVENQLWTSFRWPDLSDNEYVILMDV